ncbi:hypothetical protein ACFVYJ_06920 [Pontibacter sp. JAM-7]|uniref:hypothetical protein n=1 Tax=Pontibacter sp. JAM-7 TaxID=3366581 RepID=UPI003AF5D037
MNISSVYQAVQQFPARNTSAGAADESGVAQITPSQQVSATEQSTVAATAQGAESVAASDQGQDLGQLSTTLVNATTGTADPGAIIDLFI